MTFTTLLSPFQLQRVILVGTLLVPQLQHCLLETPVKHLSGTTDLLLSPLSLIDVVRSKKNTRMEAPPEDVFTRVNTSVDENV